MLNLPACSVEEGRQYFKAGVMQSNMAPVALNGFCHRSYATFILISKRKPKAGQQLFDAAAKCCSAEPDL